jgi:hypothetical protein
VPKPQPKNPFHNKRNPYFEVKLCDIEGFGDPYHEDMKLESVIPAQANVLPKTKCLELQARIKSWSAAMKPVDEEANKLRCRYIAASIARGRAGPPLGTT